MLNPHRFRIRRLGDDRGAIAVEAAGFVLPALLVCVVIIGGAFNLSVARLDLETASAAAARTASLQRGPDAAATAARNSATANLTSRDITCADLTVTTDLTRWGRGGSVTVTVRCTVSMASLARMSGIPGSLTTTSTSTSPIDTFRHIALGGPTPARRPGGNL